MNAQDTKALADAQNEGKVRLSLIDVMYGVIMGYGFNFFVDRDPSDITATLFLLAIIAIVCDWLFVHNPYWKQPESYTNWIFVIDLVILLTFAFMIRFAVKPPHVGELISLGVVFSLYALWDIVFREGLKEGGRKPFLDFFWDLGAAIGYFSLAKYADTKVLSSKLIELDLPNWVGFDIELKNWMAIAILLYAVIGPHPLGDMILRRSPRPL